MCNASYESLMATTLRHIAAHLKVSPTLISGVLNNRPNVWASEETRRRIFEAARELDYRPSASARALATGKTRQIAVLSLRSERSHSVAAGVPDVRGLVDAAAARDYRVVVLPLADGAEGARQLDNLLGDRICDAVCLMSSQVSRAQLNVLEKRATPTVIIGAIEEPMPPNVASFDYDNFAYGFDSARWLLEAGHKRLAWIKASGEADQPHVLELQRGFTSACQERGVEPLFVPHFERDEEIVPFLRESGTSAVVVRYPHRTLQWLFHLSARGVKLPDDLTILAHLAESDLMSFHNAGLDPFFACHLHCQRHLEQMAGEALLDWIEGRQPVSQRVACAPSQPDWASQIQIAAPFQPLGENSNK